MERVKAKRLRDKARNGALVSAALTAALILAPGARAGELPVKVTPYGGAFQEPLYVTHAPGNPNLVFVVEKGGTVEVVRNGRQLSEPFLDISNLISKNGEQGLLSIAFPPDYANSGRFYAYFTNLDCNPDSGGCDIEVAEFKRRSNLATRARRNSRRTVITIRHRDARNHNGGTAAFGPDGKLWLATGDGGGGNDQFNNASRRKSLLGKLLRIDPRKPKGDSARGYRVPNGNPFVGKKGRNEIWSIGLRNPFRFSFDGDNVAIGDVGQSAREELDIVAIESAKGADFGWPAREGKIQGPHPERATRLPRLDPIHDYPRPPAQNGGVSVTGGLVVSDPRLAGTAFDPANGRYIFGEAFSQPTVRSFIPNVEAQTISGFIAHSFGIPSVVGFGEDSQRRVYIASLSGTVYRLDPVNP
ncbi:MAG: PQQ-dependent sugar dehydrogenase [Actinomycetota bacterium]|nr:PQQ-dependent sugar dehydrogenase [Actinomycetota bacterium]